MARSIQILAIILLLQVVIAIALYSRGDEKGAFAGNEKLVDLELSSVGEIAIGDTEGGSLLLKKRGNNDWVLANHDDFPVSEKKLKKVVDALFAVTKGWPVATTKTATKRFLVDDQAYERKLVFSNKGENLKTLYLGSSPGVKQVHARVDGDDKIYLIDFGLFQASMKSVDWIDKEILKQKSEEIMKVTSTDFNLVREKNGFSVHDLKDGEEASRKDIEDYVSRVANLTFADVLGKEDKPDYGQEKPELELSVALKSGDTVNYRFSAMKDGNDHVLKASNQPFFFKLSNYSVDDLKVKRDRFVQAKKVAGKDLDSAESDSGVAKK